MTGGLSRIQATVVEWKHVAVSIFSSLELEHLS